MTAQDLLAQCARRAETIQLTSGAFARTQNGLSVHPAHPAAVAWSVYGLVTREAGSLGADDAAMRVLARSLGVDGWAGVVAWSNHPARTRAEIVDALRAAAIAAEFRAAVEAAA